MYQPIESWAAIVQKAATLVEEKEKLNWHAKQGKAALDKLQKVGANENESADDKVVETYFEAVIRGPAMEMKAFLRKETSIAAVLYVDFIADSTLEITGARGAVPDIIELVLEGIPGAQHRPGLNPD